MQQVLITGASSDIGIETCKKYLANGFQVLGHYNCGHDGFFELAEASPNMQTIKIDLSNPNAIEQAFARNEDIIKKTDVLINMAAMREPIVFAEITPDDLLRHFTVNVIPMVMLMKWIGPHMVARGWGRIVNVGSVGVKFGGGKTTCCYSLTKHAAEFMPAIHRNWAASNVFVNAVRLGVTETRNFRQMSKAELESRTALIPAKRIAMPVEMANVIYWLGSEHNTFTTGQVISPTGGE